MRAIMTGFAMLALAWVAFPSSLFVREISTTLESNNVRFVRELPFGGVTAQWESEITLESGFECNSGDWQVANYQAIPGNTVVYRLGDWAEACLAAGPPFYMTTTRRVLLGGVIPLRASRTVTEVFG